MWSYAGSSCQAYLGLGSADYAIEGGDDTSYVVFRASSTIYFFWVAVFLDFHLLLGELLGISDQIFSFNFVFLSNMANAVLIFTNGGYVKALEKACPQWCYLRRRSFPALVLCSSVQLHLFCLTKSHRTILFTNNFVLIIINIKGFTNSRFLLFFTADPSASSNTWKGTPVVSSSSPTTILAQYSPSSSQPSYSGFLLKLSVVKYFPLT